VPRGEISRLADGVRVGLKDALSRFDEPSFLRLRAELQIAASWLRDRKDAPRADAAESALLAVSRLYVFTAEIRGFAESRQAAETASVFDLGSVGILALENVLTSNVTPMRVLMSGLAEGLMFLASRQYVRGSDAVLEATYRGHVLSLQDELWALAMEFREREGLDAIREARTTIDAVFRNLEQPSVPVATRVVTIQLLYGLAVVVRCVRLLETLGSGR